MMRLLGSVASSSDAALDDRLKSFRESRRLGSIVELLSPSFPKGAESPLIKYVVTVHTSDLRGAGTDANVTLQLFGKVKKQKGAAEEGGAPAAEDLMDVSLGAARGAFDSFKQVCAFNVVCAWKRCAKHASATQGVYS